MRAQLTSGVWIQSKFLLDQSQGQELRDSKRLQCVNSTYLGWGEFVEVQRRCQKCSTRLVFVVQELNDFRCQKIEELPIWHNRLTKSPVSSRPYCPKTQHHDFNSQRHNARSCILVCCFLSRRFSTFVFGF